MAVGRANAPWDKAIKQYEKEKKEKPSPKPDKKDKK